METHEKNENRDNNITLKVTNEEKEILQAMADETGLSLSDFIRRKASANEKYFADLINENTKLREEVKDLRVKSSFGLPIQTQGNVTMNISPEKQKVWEKVLPNYKVMVDPEDDNSELREQTLGEKIEFVINSYIQREIFAEIGGEIYKECSIIDSAIKDGKISISQVNLAYPGHKVKIE